MVQSTKGSGKMRRDTQPTLADKSEGQKLDCLGILLVPHIWIFGYAENAPRHISRFHFLDFEKFIFLKKVEQCRLTTDIF